MSEQILFPHDNRFSSYRDIVHTSQSFYHNTDVIFQKSTLQSDAHFRALMYGGVQGIFESDWDIGWLDVLTSCQLPCLFNVFEILDSGTRSTAVDLRSN